LVGRLWVSLVYLDSSSRHLTVFLLLFSPGGLIDNDFRTYWASEDIYYDTLNLLLGFALLASTNTFVAASGLEASTRPRSIESEGFLGKLQLTIYTVASLWGQVSFGLGVYNMFDSYLVEEEYVWYNVVCFFGGLILVRLPSLLLSFFS
jgi:hypothetical protein